MFFLFLENEKTNFKVSFSTRSLGLAMNAWLLTWEGTAGAAVRPDEKIIAILSSRLSTPVGLVQAIYHRSVDTAYDMSRTANKSKSRANVTKASKAPALGTSTERTHAYLRGRSLTFQCIKMKHMVVKLFGG